MSKSVCANPDCGKSFKPIRKNIRHCSKACGASTGLTVAQRFWAKVEKRDPDECWPWTGQRDKRGYGLMSVRGKLMLVSRLSLALHGTPPPAAMDVCHRCDNPPCVRPDHLFLGTAKDNARDAVRKGRCGAAKLTPAQVPEVLAALRRGLRQAEVARLFGVSQSAISLLASGRTWAGTKDGHA